MLTKALKAFCQSPGKGSSLCSPGPTFPGCKGSESGLGLGWGLTLTLTITNRRRAILTNHRRIRGEKGGTCPYHPTKKRFAHRVLCSPVTYKAGNIGPGEHRYAPVFHIDGWLVFVLRFIGHNDFVCLPLTNCHSIFTLAHLWIHSKLLFAVFFVFNVQVLQLGRTTQCSRCGSLCVAFKLSVLTVWGNLIFLH